MRQFAVVLARVVSACMLGNLAVLAGCTPTPVGLVLNNGQQTQVARAQDYLNELNRFEARFDQSGSFGTGSGSIVVDRPGRLRLTYFGPQGQQMVANGRLFVIYNPANGATTTTPVARTPLGLLLAGHIALSGDVVVTSYASQGDTVSLTVADTTHPGQGTLAVTLQTQPWLLTRVTATDIRGRSLSLSLSDLNRHPVITPALFDYPGSVLPGS